MYRTHVGHCEKNRTMLGEPLPYLADGEKFKDEWKGRRDPLPDRWRSVPEKLGKSEWKPVSSKKPFGSVGFFASYTHDVTRKGGKTVVDAYNDRTSYASSSGKPKTVSFGSAAAPMRDQFSLFFEQERYREALKRELRFSDKVLTARASAAPSDGAAAAAASSSSSSSSSAAAAAAAAASSSPARSQSARRWGPAKRMGSYSLASDEIGAGMEAVRFSSPQHRIVSNVSQFFNKGHLGAPTGN